MSQSELDSQLQYFVFEARQANGITPSGNGAATPLCKEQESMCSAAGLQGGNFVNHSLKKPPGLFRHCSDV